MLFFILYSFLYSQTLMEPKVSDALLEVQNKASTILGINPPHWALVVVRDYVLPYHTKFIKKIYTLGNQQKFELDESALRSFLKFHAKNITQKNAPILLVQIENLNARLEGILQNIFSQRGFTVRFTKEVGTLQKNLDTVGVVKVQVEKKSLSIQELSISINLQGQIPWAKKVIVSSALNLALQELLINAFIDLGNICLTDNGEQQTVKIKIKSKIHPKEINMIKDALSQLAEDFGVFYEKQMTKDLIIFQIDNQKKTLELENRIHEVLQAFAHLEWSIE